MLAAGGKNLVTLKPGTFATTPEPLLGANPPKPKARPPLRPATPCETQQTPDLRSVAAPPPPQRTIDTNAPALKARYRQAREKAVRWLQRQIRIEGLQDRLKLGGKDATPQLLEQIAARVRRGG